MSYFVNKELPLLFLHIPKTGGASVLNFFNSQFKDNVYTVTNNRTMNTNYHSTLQDFDNFLCPIENPYIFTIVRNPWSRAVSWFFFRKEVLRQGIKSLSANKFTYKIKNLKSAIKEHKVMEKGFDNWLLKYYNSCWDYTWFSLSDNQSTWLKSNNYRVDYVIKLESLYSDLQKNDMLKRLEIPHVNKSESSNVLYRDIYSTISKDFIGKLYQEDIDTFKYSF